MIAIGRSTNVHCSGCSGFTFPRPINFLPTLNPSPDLNDVFGASVPTKSANKSFAKNVLAASVIASTMGIPWEGIKKQINSFKGVKSRCQIIKKNGFTIIDDSYNANLTSSLAALDYLFQVPTKGKRHFVFGDMLELGNESQKAHQEIGKFAAKNIDVLFTIGDLGLTISEAAHKFGNLEASHINERNTAAQIIANQLRPGDAILIKGSRGLRLETVVMELSKILSEIYTSQSFSNNEVEP